MKSPPIKRARPTAAISTSARAHTARRSRVREWHTVTVALAPSSSAAIGLPNRFERPTTTASAPSSATLAAASNSITPSGVHGRRPGRPSASRPAFSGVSPSTSLRGSMIAVSAVPSSCPGSGSCSRMPLTLSSALSPSSSLATSSADASAGRRLSKGTMPTSAQARCLARTYTSEPASLPTSTVASPGAEPVRALNSRTSAATSPRTRTAIAFPSMIVAPISPRS